VLAKATTFLTNYIAKLTPVDTPETSVKTTTETATGPGQQTR